MVDPALLPRGREIPSYAVDPATLGRIRRRASRRRTTRALLTCSTAVTVALAAVLGAQQLTGPPKADSLRMGPAVPAAPDETTSAPSSLAPAPASTTSRQPAALAPPPKTAPTSAGDDRASAGPIARPKGPSPALPRATADPPTRREFTAANRHSVNVCGALENAPGWCIVAVPRVSSPSQLNVTVCRRPTSSPAQLTFSTSKEAEFVVTDAAGRVRWSYDPVVGPQEEPANVLPTQCLQFILPWAVVDEGGRALPAGSYTLRARSLSQELSGVVVQSTFSVSGPAR